MEENRTIIRTNGRSVGYAEYGDAQGYPVVHFHGTPSSRLELSRPLISESAGNLGLRLIVPDRPGIGLTPFERYTLVSYPNLVAELLDALGVGQFSITALSGGGKYACACALRLSERVTGMALVSSVASHDLPGVVDSLSKQDRQAYLLARRANWLLRLFLRRAKRDINQMRDMFPDLPPADEEVLAREDTRAVVGGIMREALRQGTKGAAWDWRIEATPWGIPLREIRTPVHIWHGEEDRIVSIAQGRALEAAIPNTTAHYIANEGHLSLTANRFPEILAALPR
ncbi:MAG: hypothetical protein DCC58_09460 [Chloroflexi bacterium]|nr:MAG: hypothetical protein DCC58_09460 [Chloroflexota bacterium]